MQQFDAVIKLKAQYVFEHYPASVRYYSGKIIYKNIRVYVFQYFEFVVGYIFKFSFTDPGRLTAV